MTTEAFASNLSPAAQAMKRVFDLASAGQRQGTIACPKCGSALRFTAPQPHRSSGLCAAAGCLRWNTL